MEGPFFPVRNSWQNTTLERIKRDIKEVNQQILMEKQTLNYLSETKKIRKQKTISDLQKTVEILKIEERNRQERVLQLKTQRGYLINKIKALRNTSRKNPDVDEEIENIIKLTNVIDNELGPFRNLDQPFYMA